MNTHRTGYIPERLRFDAFDPLGFPRDVLDSDQVKYLRCYLADLEAQSVLEEPYYFDRDYLSEFTTFYASSARGYANACRRLSVFSLRQSDLRVLFSRALAGDSSSHAALQAAYLGFVVVRPISATPLGRTVLRWYPDVRPGSPPRLPRETSPSRTYRATIAGLQFSVDGLAWQQQDTAVGACATIALWTMFHSSALDEKYAIPTTAEITSRANQRWPLADRVFPSTGLHVYQLCEAIRAQGLQAGVLEGDTPTNVKGTPLSGFNPTRFSASCAGLLRSGIPLLIGARTLDGSRVSGLHAVCAVGFRPALPAAVKTGQAVEEDNLIEHLYLHDDNLGPNVRFSVGSIVGSDGKQIAVLRCDPPAPLARPASLPDPTKTYWSLIPTSLVVALPPEVRMTTDFLYGRALTLAALLSKAAQAGANALKLQLPGTTFAARFFRLRDYLGAELPKRLSGATLLKARLALVERTAPMSLHIGIVRVGMAGTPIVDVLYDTTDSEPATLPFAHVLFQSLPPALVDGLGVRVRAF